MANKTIRYKMLDKTPDKVIERHCIETAISVLAGSPETAELLDKDEMFFVRDELTAMGYKIWEDFSIIKIEEEHHA